MEVAIEIVRARGHENVKGLHKSTLEVTREDYLTPRGDCIIGVAADKAAATLSPEVKDILRDDRTKVILLLYCDGAWDIIVARGSSKLVLGDEKRIIVRRSSYIEPATIAINADKAARDVSRDLVRKLRSGDTELLVIIVAVRP